MNPNSSIPQELVGCIAQWLFQNDILQCQLVSKSWHEKWHYYTLNRIHTRGPGQFNAIGRFLGLQPEIEETNMKLDTTATTMIGQSVRTLIIQKGSIKPSALAQLPRIFPRIESFLIDEIALSDAAKSASIPDHRYTRQQKELQLIKANFVQRPSKWRTTLKCLVEINGSTVTSALLLPSIEEEAANVQITVNLRKLYVRFNNPNDRINGKSQLLRKGLANAPFLETFSLENVYLDIEELQLIHEQCPQLKRLRLADVMLCPIDSATVKKCICSKEVQPVRLRLQVLDLIDIGYQSHESKKIWLDYLSQRYGHLQVSYLRGHQPLERSTQQLLPKEKQNC